MPGPAGADPTFDVAPAQARGFCFCGSRIANGATVAAAVVADLEGRAVLGKLGIQDREADRPEARALHRRGDDPHLGPSFVTAAPASGSGRPLDLERLEPLRGVAP